MALSWWRHLMQGKAQPSRRRGRCADLRPERAWSRLQVDLLETRCLLSAGVTEFPLPSPTRTLAELTTGPDGNLWFTEPAERRIGRITPSGSVTEFPLLDRSSPVDITAGPQGSLWFTVGNRARIESITPAGVFSGVDLPDGTIPLDLTAATDGNLWFTVAQRGQIGRLDATGVVRFFELPQSQRAFAITAGIDGDVWFTAADAAQYHVGRISADGELYEFLFPGARVGRNLAAPKELAADHAGNLWLATAADHKIRRLTPAGVFTEFTLPAASSTLSITFGPDGNLWFTYEAGQIGRLSAEGVVTQFTVSTTSIWDNLTLGPNGNLWFTEPAPSRIGKLDVNVFLAAPSPGGLSATSATSGTADNPESAALPQGGFGWGSSPLVPTTPLSGDLATSLTSNFQPADSTLLVQSPINPSAPAGPLQVQSGSATAPAGPAVIGPLPQAPHAASTDATGQSLWTGLPQQRVPRGPMRNLGPSVESLTPPDPPARGPSSRPPVLTDVGVTGPALVGWILAEGDAELRVLAPEFFLLGGRTESHLGQPSGIPGGGLTSDFRVTLASFGARAGLSPPVPVVGAVLHKEGTEPHFVRGALGATVFSSFLVPVPPEGTGDPARSGITRAEEYLARLERLERAGRRVGAREMSEAAAASEGSGAKRGHLLLRLAIAWLLLHSGYQTLWPRRLGPGEPETPSL